MNQRRAGVKRARHGDEAFVLRAGQIFPALGLLLGTGVVNDAGGDELGAVEVAFWVVKRFVVSIALRAEVGLQMALLFQRGHGHAVGNQQHVRVADTGSQL